MRLKAWLREVKLLKAATSGTDYNDHSLASMTLNLCSACSQHRNADPILLPSGPTLTYHHPLRPNSNITLSSQHPTLLCRQSLNLCFHSTLYVPNIGLSSFHCICLCAFLSTLKVLHHHFRNEEISPGWCSSMDWVRACKPKGHQFNSQSGHRPGLRARSPVGCTWEATTHWCFSPSLSPSLPLSVKINK